MKNFTLLLISGLFLWTNPFDGFSQPKADKENTGIHELGNGFDNPPKEYRPAPLWVWNDKMSRAAIDIMLADLKNKGFGGAFVHPRPGLIPEYLSEEWFDLFRYSVEKGMELGLNIWIYDENSYPSGFAGGHVPAQMPESYNQGQGLKMTQYEVLPDSLSDYYLILSKAQDSYKDVTNALKDYLGKPGQFYVFGKTYYGKSPWYGGFSYVDLLLPGVTRKFQEITMSGYEKIAGDQFGKIVPGIFTDEPEIPTPGGIRWTPDLFDVFQKKWGYDLKVNLPSLFDEVGDWKRIRHNYIETLLQLFIDRWAKPWYEYCEKNNLSWTGHYWEHGWPSLAQGGDNMAMYAWHQQPAIDMLFNQFNETSPRAQFGNVRAVKELRSVANQLGYKRTLCETYGGGGWDETFEDFKRLGDWTYVLGVNFMNQHLSHSTLKGARKYDYPPVFTYHSPWWPHYKTLNDYFGRLSFVLSNGEQINDILILEPTTTLWNYYSYVQGNETLEKIGQEFQRMITQLEKQQVEYDLGSENIIKDNGEVKDGKFIIGKRNYSLVVIPPFVENVEKATFDLLEEFVKQGGKIVSYSIPERISGKIDKRVAELFQSNHSSILLFDQFNEGNIGKHFSSSEIQFSNVEGGDLFHQRRKYKDGQVIFLVNTSLSENSRGSIGSKGSSCLKMDAFTGKMNKLPCKKVAGELILDFDLPPAGSLLLFVSENETDLPVVPAEYKHENVVKTDAALEIAPLRENAMKIDFCDLLIDDEVHKGLYFSKAADIAFDRYGFQGNPWNHSVQYKKQIVDRDTFQTGGFTVKYYFDVEGDVTDNNMKICVERPEIFEVRVNDSKVIPIPGRWFLDRSFPVYDASRLIKAGTNVIELVVNPMSIHAEIEPVYVIGDFMVWSKDTGWYIDTNKTPLGLGSWKKQGYPFYSWEVAYKNTYHIDELNKSYKISDSQWDGTVSEVWVNRRFAGIIAFAPFELDVSDFMKIGSNEIELRIIGSLKNLLGPHFKDPAPGLAGPGHWKNVEKNIPGADYQMMDYGLLENIKLISNE